jgi:hypothetical protein
MKEPDGSGYFKTLKQSMVFMKEPVVLSEFFSGSLTLKLFSLVSENGNHWLYTHITGLITSKEPTLP